MMHHHDMPFGAAIRADGATRFRLWAPGAARVDLIATVEQGQREIAMHECGGGWREAILAETGHGSRYGFRIDGGIVVPDPASRSNPDDVHALSEVVDPRSFDWSDDVWRGRAWEEAVIYELHVGTFTAAGTFDAASERLDYLVGLGVTAIEVMPVADFPGTRNWGYDGVLPFAPDATYGEPNALKRLVQAAHTRGLMVLLDVVYNHFGPEGNYLHHYAPQFFNARHQTPWGAAINFDGEHSRTVRDFFIHNALFWLEEYQFDGLRLDAVHAIADDSALDIVSEIAAAVRSGPGRTRNVHLVLENDRNQARYLLRDGAHLPTLSTAQWNDDIHHAAHVLVTGERDGYYVDYATKPLWQLARCLAEGFGYQGEASAHRGDNARGEPSADLPPTAFVNFLQTHDQVGNRAFGERIAAIAEPRALDALAACILLAPSPPMLFMGEEFAASTPFLFFCDFGPELAAAVTEGRRNEFANFDRFRNDGSLGSIPDPNARESFVASKLDWTELDRPQHRAALAGYRNLLALRHEYVIPSLAQIEHCGRFEVRGPGLLRVDWWLGGTRQLHLLANLCDTPALGVSRPPGRCFYTKMPVGAAPGRADEVGAWVVEWSLQP
ncbi:MAG: malto-oligosyltrehalose trehalohydrolase [Casimicrobiaceae bacterium]